MEIDVSAYIGPCSCGASHDLLTRRILIGRGAVEQLRDVVVSLGLTGAGSIVCDANTQPYAEQAQEILGDCLLEHPVTVLGPVGFHADEHAVDRLQKALPEKAKWLLAVGSGTIHDTTRYVAKERKIPFVSFPTAASVDGFVATVCAMTWYGFKKTLPAVAPLAVVADSNIFSKAPYRLTASGIGDVLGKYTALLDWKVAHLLAGHGYCSRISDLTREAADNVMEHLDDIAHGDVAGCEKLMFALVLSGLAMQLWQDSQPASGAEHHLSHLWEMEVLNGPLDALHGEKVGVGLLLVLEEYARLAAIPAEMLKVEAYKGMPLELIHNIFGDLYDAVLEENGEDLLLEVDLKQLRNRMEEVRALIAQLPDRRSMECAMKRAGCKTSMEELGLSADLAEKSIQIAPFARRRMTFLRISKLLTCQ